MRTRHEIILELYSVRRAAHGCLSDNDDRSMHVGSLVALAWVLGPEYQRRELAALGKAARNRWLFGLAESVGKIADNDALSWADKYEAIFSDSVSVQLAAAGMVAEYTDPDGSYEDDVRAFRAAVDERLAARRAHDLECFTSSGGADSVSPTRDDAAG